MLGPSQESRACHCSYRSVSVFTRVLQVFVNRELHVVSYLQLCFSKLAKICA